MVNTAGEYKSQKISVLDFLSNDLFEDIITWKSSYEILREGFRDNPHKKDKCRRKGKGHRCCLGDRVYSIPCGAHDF